MNKLTLLTALLLASAFAPLSASAQTTAPAVAEKTATDKPAMKNAADAEVRKIDKEAKKITLKHGPIKHLDMPSMTMVFQVRDAALFDKVAVGDKILFTAEQLQGAYVMTGVEKAETK